MIKIVIHKFNFNQIGVMFIILNFALLNKYVTVQSNLLCSFGCFYLICIITTRILCFDIYLSFVLSLGTLIKTPY